MSLSPTSSTVPGSGEKSPTSTAQGRSSPLEHLDTPATEDRITSSPTLMSPENSKLKLEEDMDSENSPPNLNSTFSPSKVPESNENRANGEYGLPSTSPIPAAEIMEAANCRSPNAMRMASSTSPLPATTSPVPKTPLSTEAQQQLITPLGASPAVTTPATLNGSTSCIQTVTTDDLEEVMMELNKFDRQHIKEWKEKVSITIPPLLEGYLQFVANGGNTHFSWTAVKGLFKVKLNHVINDFYSESPTDEIPTVPNVESFDYSNVKEKLFLKLDTFSGIPFTIQRLAELLTSPKRHYRRTDKFLRALEKNMLVVSTVEARVAPPIPDQLSLFPPPHHLPASLHSGTKSRNHHIFENGPSESDACSIKENDQNGPSSRLQESSSSQRNGSLTSSLSSNTSPNRSLTALENNPSVLNMSPNQCSNVTSGWNRSPTGERGEKLNSTSKEAAKNANQDVEYEDEDEDDEEEDEDGEDMELNVGTPSDVNEIHATRNCSSDRIVEQRKNVDNTQNSKSSTAESKKSIDENHERSSIESKKTEASSTAVNEDRENQKRKLANIVLAADDGTPNKVFVTETQSISEAQSHFGETSIVTSASEISNDGAKEKDSFKNSPKRNWGSSGSLTSSGMTITPCTKSSPADCQDNIECSGSSVTISKNIAHQKHTSDHTPTKEVPSGRKDENVTGSPSEMSVLKSIVSPVEAQMNSDRSIIKEVGKSSVNIASNEDKGTVHSTIESKKIAVGVNEVDSSISKSVVLSSGDDLVPEEDEEKEDAMDVDTECSGSESHIETSSSNL